MRKVIAPRYCKILEQFSISTLQDTPKICRQHNVAAAHTARITMRLLSATFGERLGNTSSNAEYNWSAISTDLNAADLSLGTITIAVFILKSSIISNS